MAQVQLLDKKAKRRHLYSDMWESYWLIQPHLCLKRQREGSRGSSKFTILIVSHTRDATLAGKRQKPITYTVTKGAPKGLQVLLLVGTHSTKALNSITHRLDKQSQMYYRHSSGKMPTRLDGKM